LVVLAPFISAIIAWWSYSQILEFQPFYINADPEIAYLLSSLSVFKGDPYTFIDHPGTPVEMLGTLMLGATYPFVSNLDSSFFLYHISHPDTFLIITRIMLTATSIVAMTLLGLKTVPGKHWTDAIAAAGVALLYFAVHPRAFESIVNWSHNSFSFPLGAILGLGVVLLLVDKGGGTWKEQSVLGLAIGFLVAVQLYFVTWLAGALVAMYFFYILSGQGWKRGCAASLRVTVTVVAGFILSTLPIVNRYSDFFNWIVRIASHQGRHGSGPPGFISLPIVISNFIVLWKEVPILFLLVGILGVLTIGMALFQRHSLKTSPALWALALGLSSQIGLMTLLVLKHPGIIYLQAVAATIPLLVAVTIPLIGKSLPRMKSVKRLLKFGFGIVAFVLFFLTLARSMYIHRLVTQQVHDAVEVVDTYLDDLAFDLGRERRSLTILWVYGMPSKCAALWYGNQYTDYALADEISSVCPRDLIFNLWENRVVLSNGSSVPVDQSSWDIIVANEAAIIDFPTLTELGTLDYSEARLGTFGKVVYILPSHY